MESFFDSSWRENINQDVEKYKNGENNEMPCGETECRFYISELYIYVALVRSQIIGALTVLDLILAQAHGLCLGAVKT